MILDTSALLAVLFDEADADHYEHTIGDATACRMSVANYLEAILVIESRLGEEGGRELDNYLEAAEIELVSVTTGAGAGCSHGLAQVRQGQSPRRSELR